MKQFFITGIGTDVGKTVASAILVEALEADYWKPIQAGELENTDAQKIKSLISNSNSFIHPETFLLSTAMSPHAAAEIDNIKMVRTDFSIPETSNSLIIEGAGGVMVPINDEYLILDLIERLDLEVILVVSNYLGSINHTLLTINALNSRNIPIAGIIFNGEPTPSSKEFILQYSRLKCLLTIQEEKVLDKKTILKYKEALSEWVKELVG